MKTILTFGYLKLQRAYTEVSPYFFGKFPLVLRERHLCNCVYLLAIPTKRPHGRENDGVPMLSREGSDLGFDGRFVGAITYQLEFLPF